MRIIEIVGMDGFDRKVFAVVNMEEFVGLIFDYVMGRFYWISKYKEVLQIGQEEKVNFFGRGLG